LTNQTQKKTGLLQSKLTWNQRYGRGEVINTLIEAGLRLEFLHAFPFASQAKFPGMVKGDDDGSRFTDHRHEMIPLLFSLQARKPL
jgi:hypothetical protein